MRLESIGKKFYLTTSTAPDLHKFVEEREASFSRVTLWFCSHPVYIWKVSE